MQGWTASIRHEVTRKICTKRLKHTGNLFRKNLQLKMSVNSRLTAIQIISQKKAFCRQKISRSSCARKGTVDIDILIKSRKSDKKIMHSIRIMRRPSLRITKCNKFSRFKWTSTKIIPIKESSWQYSNYELRI